MSPKKIVVTLVVIVLVIVLFWYLLIKDYNYKIAFETPQAPGTVYSSLYNWNQIKPSGLDSILRFEPNPYKSIAHNIHVGDSSFSYNWKIDRVNDSLTKVTAYIKDDDHSLIQNLIVPFKTNDFVKRNIALVEQFMNGLYLHEKTYNVNIVQEKDIIVPSQFCAYISLRSKIYEKGNTMISNIGLIMNYIKDNNIPLKGDPFLQVTKWDVQQEIIEYDFCFPIVKLDSMPETKTIKFKNTQEFSALKAIFNGNYRLTDRAWYELLDYADNNGLNIQMNPYEIYRNDPHSGGNELEWVAEVYMPLKN